MPLDFFFARVFTTEERRFVELCVVPVCFVKVLVAVDLVNRRRPLELLFFDNFSSFVGDSLVERVTRVGDGSFSRGSDEAE